MTPGLGPSSWIPSATNECPPWQSIALITAQGAGEWQVALADDRAVLKPLGVRFSPQRLNDDAWHALLRTLESTTDTDDAPHTLDDELADVLTTHDLTTAVRLTTEGMPGRSRTTPIPEERRDSVTSEHEPTTAPTVRVLGPVDVVGLPEGVVMSRARRNTELVAYLALNPGGTTEMIDEVIGRGDLVSTSSRNAFVSRTRGWLGTTPDGEPYLPRARDARYRLHDDVRCDWHHFLALAHRGLDRGEDGADELRAALGLMRGRPFLGVAPGTYTWSDMIAQEMIATIADVAHALAVIDLRAERYTAVVADVARGLSVDACNEQLFHDAVEGALRRGDAAEVDRLEAECRERMRRLNPGIEVGLPGA